uniref:DNA repair protein RAD51 homolog 4-like n=1 Tax=Phallusia mammillata TaxID=59560 RepID=A0A6F9DPP1_9ASCI|nr:DNA repair protein RAD51 homolog 4-like [Phallusia mammillata]
MYATSYVEGMSDVQKMGREINKLAKDFAIALVVVNDVVSTSVAVPSATTSNISFSKKPALGRCWSYVPSVRLTFEPVTEPTRLLPKDIMENDRSMDFTVSVTKSPRSFNRSIGLSVTRHGIVKIQK